MQISAIRPVLAPSTPPPAAAASQAQPVDQYAGSMRRVAGTIGTAAGVVAGRVLLLPGTGALAGRALAGALLGPVGAVAGTVIGAAAGAWLEKKSRLGRFVGGLAGGAVGVVAGAAGDVVGLKPSEMLARETKGFTYSSLFHKLMHPEYTSHQPLGAQAAAELMSHAQPGDLIVTTHDRDFKFEVTQKMLGQSGDWTHVGFVSQKGTLLESLINTNGPTESDATRLADEYHAMLLRPKYKDAASVAAVEKASRDALGTVKYDFKFRMGTDDVQYCQEYTYKALQKGAPEIDVKPSKLFGFPYVVADDFLKSPDVDVVATTGSSYWVNWLSKFS